MLHQGGSGAILPKIKATWPHAEYDYVAGWEGSFNGMIKEDWLVPVTVETVPNLADIPQKIIVKNAKGEWMAVPRAVGGIYFAYRKDICPIEVKSIDDLFDPRLKGKICWPGPTQSHDAAFGGAGAACRRQRAQDGSRLGADEEAGPVRQHRPGRGNRHGFLHLAHQWRDRGRLLLGAATDGRREIVPRRAADQAGRHADLPLSKWLCHLQEPAEPSGDAGVRELSASARR